MNYLRKFLSIILVFIAFSAHAEEKKNFADWIDDFKQEAISKGISKEIVDSAFANISEPLENVIELDGKQPEKTILFSEYAKNIVSKKRVAAAKDKLHSLANVLRKIENEYQVDKSTILALWAIESNFGKNQGNFSVIQSLATLAFEGRRSKFFRSELLDSLKILEQEQINPEDLTGSWAGAMGQTQFMPSSFLKFAVDFDDDGKKDIWQNDSDALASIANYLHKKDWKLNQGWGIKVELPDTEKEKWLEMKQAKTIKEWSKLGIKLENGKNLPKKSFKARLIIPEDEEISAFLVFPNYDIIMDWNRSIYFATSVGLLSDAIRKK